MDPVSLTLLAALASGAAGEVGKQAWTSLGALVRRPFGGSDQAEPRPGVSSGEAELVGLQQDPADPVRAQALSAALAVRAALDADFATALQQWSEHARLVRTGDGDVRNEISGGTFNGPVLQGRDFSGISFNTPPAHRPAP
ncbi:hypothetical protein [Streptomyces doebereineriae]|uniref:Uncharacterized protein n=1 Tax=Streptomyces doebereineriae TaxID=3075528 RepID=A0ABU2VE04_9ACTN|nr:hypothetical protein [Streptomyces sp. DSM 41640]MDT0483806.1 hypothetical protein [Streptomyces sp. DSM 41640]